MNFYEDKSADELLVLMTELASQAAHGIDTRANQQRLRWAFETLNAGILEGSLPVPTMWRDAVPYWARPRPESEHVQVQPLYGSKHGTVKA
jgi:hypothetical protein